MRPVYRRARPGVNVARQLAGLPLREPPSLLKAAYTARRSGDPEPERQEVAVGEKQRGYPALARRTGRSGRPLELAEHRPLPAARSRPPHPTNRQLVLIDPDGFANTLTYSSNDRKLIAIDKDDIRTLGGKKDCDVRPGTSQGSRGAGPGHDRGFIDQPFVATDFRQ